MYFIISNDKSNNKNNKEKTYIYFYDDKIVKFIKVKNKYNPDEIIKDVPVAMV